SLLSSKVFGNETNLRGKVRAKTRRVGATRFEAM
ncbi:uncharacterized protein METZ01_LOCUS348887, partial [marine metagenome]